MDAAVPMRNLPNPSPFIAIHEELHDLHVSETLFMPSGCLSDFSEALAPQCQAQPVTINSAVSKRSPLPPYPVRKTCRNHERRG